MKKFFIVYISLFLCEISISGYAQSFGEAFIPEQLLPENTLAVCVFTNLQETVEKFKQTLLSEIMDTAVVEKMHRDFSIFAEEFCQNAGFCLPDIWAIFHKSIAIALVDISSGDIMGTDIPYPKFAFIADVTGSVNILKNLLETIVVPGLQAKEPTVEFFVESFEGINIYVLANKQFQVHYTFLDSAFVLALEQETIQKIISVSKPVLSSTEGSLFNALPYRSAARYMPEDGHEARIYVNIRDIWLKLRPYIRQACSNRSFIENTIILDILDQYNLQVLFWTFSYKDRGGYERMFFRIKNQKNRDLLSVLSDVGNGTFTSDQIIPANILYYRASRVNLPELWQQLSTLINASSYPQQIEQFNSWVRRIEDTSHLDIEKELLAAFDREFALVCYTGEFRHRFAREKLSPEDFPFLVLFQVKDKGILERTLQKISTAFHIESHKEIYQNTEIQSITLPGKIASLTVYTAFVKDFFVVSISRTMVQEVITVSQHGSSLAVTEDYLKLSSYFPARGYSKGYINIKKLSGLIRRFLNRINQTEPPFRDDKSELALDLISRAERLSGIMWVTTVVSDGFLTESFSPVGGTVTGIAIAWLGLSLLE